MPDVVDADLAELVGYFMGDGSLHAQGIRFCVADTDLDVVERLRILGKELFDLEAAVTPAKGYQEVTFPFGSAGSLVAGGRIREEAPRCRALGQGLERRAMPVGRAGDQ